MEKEKNKYNLFLDDWRVPLDCATYMYQRGVNCTIYHDEWKVVRSYGDFVLCIMDNGMPERISFDYDLDDVFELKETLPIHYWFDIDNNRSYTGLDCAKWLLRWSSKKSLNIPEIIIHSANPDGTEELKKLFNKK